MNIDDGKKIYITFEAAQKAASQMRFKYNESYTPYKSGTGWAVGGNHMNTKSKYKRIKNLSDIRELFNDIQDEHKEDRIIEYHELISKESTSDKESTTNGEEGKWILMSFEKKLGTQLGMSNTKQYLTLLVTNNTEEKLTLKMGGAFEKAIPIIEMQAALLINRPIIWHTWNSKFSQAKKWGSDSWFYMIEKA